MKARHAVGASLLLVVALPGALHSQALDLTIRNVGLAIGDKPQMTGLRLNFADRELRQVNGINVTVWSPSVVPQLRDQPIPQAPAGTVNGFAIGLPVLDANRVHGVAVALLGNPAAIGMGAGDPRNKRPASPGEFAGITVAPVGFLGTGTMTGLAIGGLATGADGDVRGIQVGGLFLGGRSLAGISLSGGLVGGDSGVAGLNAAGIALISFRSVKGINVGGAAIYGRENVEGINASVGWVAARGTVRWLTIASMVDAARVDGAFIGLAAEAHQEFRGVGLGVLNAVEGVQHGLMIGLFNYARELNGVQLGLLNISENGGKRRRLPIINIGRRSRS
jgi:hypothetical protein